MIHRIHLLARILSQSVTCYEKISPQRAAWLSHQKGVRCFTTAILLVPFFFPFFFLPSQVFISPGLGRTRHGATWQMQCTESLLGQIYLLYWYSPFPPSICSAHNNLTCSTSASTIFTCLLETVSRRVTSSRGEGGRGGTARDAESGDGWSTERCWWAAPLANEGYCWPCAAGSACSSLLGVAKLQRGTAECKSIQLNTSTRQSMWLQDELMCSLWVFK